MLYNLLSVSPIFPIFKPTNFSPVSKKAGPVKSDKKNANPGIEIRPDFFETLGPKASWLVLGLILLVSFIVFKDFLLLKKVYLFKDIGSDSLNASWPWMTHSADYIAQYGVPSWSFNMGMGQNILSFSCYDPFDYILYMFGRDNMPYLIVYKELAKILLAGFLFFKYLKLLNLSNYTATIGALVFAFCGYMVLGSGWFLFSFEVFVAALLLYSFELLFQKNKWYWFAIPIFLIGISRPFNLWTYAVFLTLYILFRVYQSEEKFDLKKITLLFSKILAVSIIGLGLSAPLLLEHLQVMIDSPRGSGPDSQSQVLASMPMFQTADKMEFGTAMLRLFANDIMGSGMKFKGWTNFLEAPEFYCGLPCLLLFTQFFSFLSKRTKRFAIALLVIWLLPVIFPYFRRAFYLFSGDYYRTYSFFVALTLIFFSVSAFDKMLTQQKVNLKALIISGIILFGLLNYPYFKEKDMVDGGIKLFANTFLLAYAFLIYLMGSKKQNLNYKYIFLALLVIELAYFSSTTVNRRQNANGDGNVTVKNLKEKIWYNDYTLEAVAHLKKTDSSFYRVDKNYVSTPAIHGSLNDAMVQNYYSTPSYNPFNQKYYIQYMKTMGVINKVNEYESRWSSGLINRFILQSLNNVKYILAMRDPRRSYSQPGWRFSHDSITQVGDVVILKNKFNLPLGFGYSKYVKLSDFESLSNAQKDQVSTRACVVNDEDVVKLTLLGEFSLKDTLPENQFTFDVLKQNTDSLKKNVLQISEFKPTRIKGSINLPASQMLYLAIPFDRGWEIKDNNGSVEKMILSNGMTGVFLSKGAHEVELEYTSLNFKKGVLISLVSFCIFTAVLFFWVRLTRKKQAIES